MTEDLPIERHLSNALSTPIGMFAHAVAVAASTPTLYLSGMTAREPDGSVACVGDAAGQTKTILDNCLALLADYDVDLSSVVKVVVYVKDMADLKAIHAVRSEVFGSIRPASTLIQVVGFVDPDMLLEIDLTAVLPEGTEIPSRQRQGQTQ